MRFSSTDKPLGAYTSLSCRVYSRLMNLPLISRVIADESQKVHHALTKDGRVLDPLIPI